METMGGLSEGRKGARGQGGKGARGQGEGERGRAGRGGGETGGKGWKVENGGKFDQGYRQKGGKFEISRMRVLVSPSFGG